MAEWEEWIVEGVYFPHLRDLQLSKCPKLRGCLLAQLPSLKRLKIGNCQQLEGQLPRLESIISLHLEGCDKVELREIFRLTTLARLNLENLTQLINMPSSGLAELPSIESLTISDCSNFISFEDPRLPKGLNYLRVSKCPALKSLPVGMFKHTRISSIDIWDCGSLEFCCSHNNGLPSSIQSLFMAMVKKIEFPKLISLEQMPLYSSLSLVIIGNDVGLVKGYDVACSPRLQTLSLMECENLENIYIPEGRGITAQNGLKSLSELYINNCPKLECVAREGLPAPNLKKVSFFSCENLKSLPSGMCTNLTSLRELSYLEELKIEGWSSVECFPEQDSLPTTLQLLQIQDFPNLKRLGREGLLSLKSLGVLGISKCPQLKFNPDQDFPSDITNLEVEHFEYLASLWADRGNFFHLFQFLTELSIKGYSSVECFPKKDSLPTTLQLLKIRDFPNLKRLDAEGLLNLKSLEKLWISNCPQLKFTPDQDFPPNLNDLAVDHFEHLTSLRADRRNFFHNFQFLTALSIAGYSSVECFPEKVLYPPLSEHSESGISRI
ncbi:hypothetical protein Ancab_022120 [Ancistrocladus abbreviatus]